MLQRIKDQCTSRGERGLFGLKRLFKTFDSNGNGMLEFKEFKKAVTDFKLGLEDQDIDSIFKSFDHNNDGVLDLNEFMDLVLGGLEGARLSVVQEAFRKLDTRQMGFVPYAKVRETFDGKKHPDVCNGRKTEEEIITEFLEIYEIHHNTHNDY